METKIFETYKLFLLEGGLVPEYSNTKCDLCPNIGDCWDRHWANYDYKDTVCATCLALEQQTQRKNLLSI